MPRPLVLLAPIMLLVIGATAAGAATNIAGTIEESQDWTIYGSPYRLTGSVTIPAGVIVTVRPGVQVIAQGSYSITVQGRLRAFGTQYRPAVFKSTTPTTPGSWGGIYFAPGSVGWFAYTAFWAGGSCVTVNGAWAKFERCWFLYAAQDGLVAYNEAAIHVDSSTFAYNQRRGLYVETPYPTGSVDDCIFMRNGEYPAYLKANCVDMLGSDLRFYYNGAQSIGVSCSANDDIVGTKTWQGQPVPLDLTAGSSDNLLIPPGASLTLQPGCRLLADRIQVYGSLTAGAGGRLPVIIRGVGDTAGCWPGIFLFAGSSGQFTNCIIRLADTGFTVDDATLVLNDTVVRDCQYDGIFAAGVTDLRVVGGGFHSNGRSGIHLHGTTISGIVDHCSISGSGDYPIFTMAANVWMLGANNVYRDNTQQAVGVACNLETDLSSSQIWQPQGIPYDLTARPEGTVLRVGQNATWSLAPGVTLAGGGIDVAGTLLAMGTAEEPLIFTTADPNGTWQGLKFYPGSAGALSHCIIEHATTGIHMQSASPRIEHCTIRQCRNHALYIAGTAQPVIFNSQIVHNDGDAVGIVDEARPNLGNLNTSTTDDDGHNVFDRNEGYDICNESVHNIRAQNNWWATENLDQIAQRIFDGNDAGGYGNVFMLPIISPADNAAPMLDWAGLPGSFHDGVSPDVAAPFSYVDFRVKYSDADGDAPRYIFLHLFKNEVQVEDSPYTMEWLTGSGGTYQDGVIYHKGLRLAKGSDYSYCFEATDGLQIATGLPTQERAGPIITSTGAAGGLIGSVVAQQAPAGNIAIHCQMISAGHISVEVLNIAGRRVARVATDRPVEAGSNLVLWNGRSHRGTKVPSGRYLVRITAAGQSGIRQQMMVPLGMGQ